MSSRIIGTFRYLVHSMPLPFRVIILAFLFSVTLVADILLLFFPSRCSSFPVARVAFALFCAVLFVCFALLASFAAASNWVVAAAAAPAYISETAHYSALPFDLCITLNMNMSSALLALSQSLLMFVASFTVIIHNVSLCFLSLLPFMPRCMTFFSIMICCWLRL